MYKAFYTQGDDYMVSSPETSSGQAIWQMKTNYNHMKRPCQIDFDTQGDDYSKHGKFHMAKT
ncbi:hypothetical protein [Labilibaculum manganireducens]|uniref:hypothetical protein n=1 Tax=Labilibaculum manganireducens TaxID=1940525 RepID=UPI0029F50B60|nr:hypothetical protein [Labilibaculum manganireducens]